jgi:hypothetical protein
MLDQAITEDLPYHLVKQVAIGRWKVGGELISACRYQWGVTGGALCPNCSRHRDFRLLAV